MFLNITHPIEYKMRQTYDELLDFSNEMKEIRRKSKNAARPSCPKKMNNLKRK
jgi:hypothetical protein